MMILLKNVQKIGTLGGPKVEKKVKCLTKWVRLAPIELKLCRNDQAMIRTSKMLILANFSQFFGGKNRFFFFLSPLPPPELTIFPVFSRTNGSPPNGRRQNLNASTIFLKRLKNSKGFHWLPRGACYRFG